MDGATQILPGSDVLQTMAQIAVAFVGFSGIVAAFSRQPGRWGSLDLLRAQNLIIVGLSAMFFALLPSGLDAADLAERTIWRGSSATMALGGAISLAGRLRMFAKLPLEERFPMSPTWLAIMAGSSFLNVVAQSMNAAAWPYEPQRAVYTFGVLYMLLLAGGLFLRLVSLRPSSD
jgi:hypothetical protein